jgi:hypothetical protein
MPETMHRVFQSGFRSLSMFIPPKAFSCVDNTRPDTAPEMCGCGTACLCNRYVVSGHIRSRRCNLCFISAQKPDGFSRMQIPSFLFLRYAASCHRLGHPEIILPHRGIQIFARVPWKTVGELLNGSLPTETVTATARLSGSLLLTSMSSETGGMDYRPCWRRRRYGCDWFFFLSR